MKTSLIIDNLLFREAKKQSNKSNSTISEIISYWAQVGYQHLKKQKGKERAKLKTVNLGQPSVIDLRNRRDYLDLLDDLK